METLQLKVDDSTMNFPQIQLTHDVASSTMSQPTNSALSHVPANPSTIEQHASTSSVPSSVPPHAPAQHLMHKNRLQEFAQRSNIALPMYQTTNEGSPHSPRFRSTVCVDGMSYTSPITFTQRKAAEQEVARLALENLMKRVKNEECPLVSENTLFLSNSKSILNEYATKLSVERPPYDTIQLEGLLPHFQSSIVFNGTKYTGDTARNKKEAEQLAARAAILSILGGSSPGTLCEIIKSKSKIKSTTLPNKSQSTDAKTVSAIASTGHASSLLDLIKDKEVPSLVACNNDVAKIELLASSIMPFASQQCQMPVDVPAPEANKLPSNTPASQELQITVHVPAPEDTKLPNVSDQPGGSEQPQQAIANTSSSKKRRKNKKKKGNKKPRLEPPSVS